MSDLSNFFGRLNLRFVLLLCNFLLCFNAVIFSMNNYCYVAPNQLQNLTRYSLSDYLPEIGDQGDVGSCVGWASTYYGLTIVKRIEHGKEYPVFAPLSTYNRFCFFNNRNPCWGGARIDGSLDILEKYGCPLLSDYAFNYCAYDPDKKKYKDRLFGYDVLQHRNALQIKMALNSNRPVVIGIQVFAGGKGNSMNTKFLDSNGVIRIENFKSDYAVSAHAMCIVGYDDEIGGGAFKLVNSWGKEWGKSGFCWLRYSDLEILQNAYALIPNDNEAPAAKTAFKTASIEVVNTSNKGIYLSLGLNTADGKRTSKGWYYISSGTSRVISIAERSKNEILYALMTENGTITQAANSGESLLVKEDGFFDLSIETLSSVIKESKSYSFKPSNKKRKEVLRIAD